MPDEKRSGRFLCGGGRIGHAPDVFDLLARLFAGHCCGSHRQNFPAENLLCKLHFLRPFVGGCVFARGRNLRSPPRYQRVKLAPITPNPATSPAVHPKSILFPNRTIRAAPALRAHRDLIGMHVQAQLTSFCSSPACAEDRSSV